MPLRACLTVCPWSGPAAAFPFDSLHLLLSTCALLLRAVVGLLSSLQACKLSSFSTCIQVQIVWLKSTTKESRFKGIVTAETLAKAAKSMAVKWASPINPSSHSCTIAVLRSSLQHHKHKPIEL
jgi:hypothetical protein